MSPMDDATPAVAGDQWARGERGTLEDWVRQEYERLGSPLRNYLAQRLGDVDWAEDLVQEVFLRLFQESRSGQIVDPRSWVFKVGHNLAVDAQRRRNVEDTWAAGEWAAGEPGAAPDSETGLLRAERRAQVWAALALLSPQERQCLELRAEGLRHREIAEVMGLRISTVGTFLTRAVRKIARRLDE